MRKLNLQAKSVIVRTWHAKLRLLNLSHPDYNCRHWNFTNSAPQALLPWRLRTITAG